MHYPTRRLTTNIENSADFVNWQEHIDGLMQKRRNSSALWGYVSLAKTSICKIYL